MAPREAGRIATQLVRWYRRHGRDLPWRRSRDPYRIWVSEVMLQQTTVRAVIPFYLKFLRRFPSLRSLASSDLPDVLTAWSGLGYYRRARHLHAAARTIVSRHSGRFPRGADDIRSLPGVGRYTAGAIRSIAFGEQEPVVDGNVARVLSRLLLRHGDPRERANETWLWSVAASLVETSRAPGDLNQALMELGATLCTPLSPACGACPLARRCRARAAGAQETIPTPRRQRATVLVRQRIALVERNGRLLMRQRRASGLMEGFWEFPPLGRSRSRVGGGLKLRSRGELATLKHAITYRRLLVQVHRADLVREPRGRAYRWVSRRDLAALPVSSLVPKVLRACSEPEKPEV